MKFTCLLLVLALFSGCSSPEDRARRQLMDRVEGSVRLPSDADPLANYSRYYAPRPDGKIAALYVIEDEDFLEKVRRACVDQDVRGFPCGPNGRVELVPA